MPCEKWQKQKGVTEKRRETTDSRGGVRRYKGANSCRENQHGVHVSMEGMQVKRWDAEPRRKRENVISEGVENRP